MFGHIMSPIVAVLFLPAISAENGCEFRNGGWVFACRVFDIVGHGFSWLSVLSL